MARDIIARGLGAMGKNNAFAATMPKMAVRCDAVSDAVEWQVFTGRAPDLIHAFANASTWAGVISAVSSACSTFAGKKLVWAFPLATGTNGSSGSVPTQDTTPAQWAAGTYDANINYCLDQMLAHNPEGPIYIRPGWEAGNYSAFPWGATTSIANARTDYIAAFQHVSALIRAKSPRFVISWCVADQNFDYTAAVVDPTNGTTGFDPGVAYYDAVGIDAYLIGNDVSNGQDFNHLAHTTANPRLLSPDVAYGMQFLANFARTNNRAMTIDEWGIGAERPDYVRDMAQLVANPLNRVLYHGYWNKNAGTQVSGQYPFPCRLSDNSNAYPLSKAAYLYYFYGRGLPVTEQPETSALIARTTSTISTSDRAAYDTFFATLRSNGLLPYLDGVSILCGMDNNITLLNLLGAGGFTTTAPRTVGRFGINGAPTFTPYAGYQGGGTTADYLRLASSSNTAGSLNSKFTQNSAHLGIYSTTYSSNAGAQTYEAGVASSFIGRIGTGLNWVGRPNTSATVSISNSGQNNGHVMWNRTGAATWASYFNGTASKSGTDASIVITADDIRVCSIPAVGAGVNQIAAVHWGAALPTSLFNGPQLMSNAIYALLHTLSSGAI